MEGIRKKRMTYILILFNICTFLTNFEFIQEAKASDISKQQSIDSTISWLLSKQNSEGFWEEGYDYNTTCDIKEIISKCNYNYTWDKTNEWLLNENNQAKNNDELSRIIKVSENKDEYINKILCSQNEDGGFGLVYGYSSDIYDTLLVLESLNTGDTKNYQSEINKIINYLLVNQKEDGSWTYNLKSNSYVQLSARIGLL